MVTVKFKVIFEREFELKPEWYPEGSTLDEMIAIDKEGIENDPFQFVDDEKVKMTIETEIVWEK